MKPKGLFFKKKLPCLNFSNILVELINIITPKLKSYLGKMTFSMVS